MIEQCCYRRDAIDTRCCWYCSCCWKWTTYTTETWSSPAAGQPTLIQQLRRQAQHHDNRCCPRQPASHGRRPAVATVLPGDNPRPTTTLWTRLDSAVSVSTVSATDRQGTFLLTSNNHQRHSLALHTNNSVIDIIQDTANGSEVMTAL